MIKHLLRNQIDSDKWDACITNAPQKLPYGFSWYLDIACENWSALVLNNYAAVMPLPYKKKFGVHYLYQPFFTQQLGIFGSGATENFLKAIPEKYKFQHLHLNYKNSIEEISNYKIEDVQNLVIHPKNKKLKEDFSTHCLRNIKKANSNDLKIRAVSVDVLIKQFRENRGKEIQHLRNSNYKTLQELINALIAYKMAEVYGIFDKKENLLGGAVFVKFRQRNIFYFSSTDSHGRKNKAMYFLLDKMLKRSNSEQITWDFEGSNDENLARFYKGFGATNENYFSLKLNNLPLPLRILKR